jgi:uncharacterized membrane protein
MRTRLLFVYDDGAAQAFARGGGISVSEKAGNEGKIEFAVGLTVFAAIFIGSGVLHFLHPEPYVRIVPPLLPWPLALVYVSGAAEIVEGAGLLVRKLRRPAAFGVALLLVAVWPANIYMAAAHVRFPGVMGESWVQWARVPLQIPLIFWALYYTKVPKAERSSASSADGAATS